jgi:hypothetical protein
MTWVKLGDDFADDCARVELTDAAFRVHVEALVWTMRRVTGGKIERRDIDRFAETDAPMAAVKELLDVGFWQKTPAGYLVVHAMADQLEPKVIKHRRGLAADRQRRKRMHEAGDHSMCLPKSCKAAPVTRDVTRDDTRDPGRDGSGLDGTGNYAPREEGSG